MAFYKIAFCTTAEKALYIWEASRVTNLNQNWHNSTQILLCLILFYGQNSIQLCVHTRTLMWFSSFFSLYCILMVIIVKSILRSISLRQFFSIIFNIAIGLVIDSTKWCAIFFFFFFLFLHSFFLFPRFLYAPFLHSILARLIFLLFLCLIYFFYRIVVNNWLLFVVDSLRDSILVCFVVVFSFGGLEWSV